MEAMLALKHETPFSPLTNVVMLWAIFVTAMISGFSFFYPEFLQSGAYQLVRDMAFGSFTFIGASFGATSLFLASGLYTRNHTLASIGLGLYMWLQFIFGLSIFVLTFSGVVSAIAGSVQWWGPVIISSYLLRRGL